jgi:hypothetical protein
LGFVMQFFMYQQEIEEDGSSLETEELRIM